ncbi:helix-turn-helix domain-containing protein [uncultured Mobiluncus sp.]|uniref:helix-turn-helix domain-containing protein n=1 Tax=uncultured Mobiluncus sp. TaxID=293425 RepID=UPI00262D442D|nr:helix-turn-helix domain-containing protein [uncultured Mobiluncus sp.]
MKSMIREVVATTPETFASLVKFHRQAFGITQQRLAQMAGVTRPAITRLEAASPATHLDTALKVLDALGVEQLTFYTSQEVSEDAEEA